MKNKIIKLCRNCGITYSANTILGRDLCPSCRRNKMLRKSYCLICGNSHNTYDCSNIKINNKCVICGKNHIIKLSFFRAIFRTGNEPIGYSNSLLCPECEKCGYSVCPNCNMPVKDTVMFGKICFKCHMKLKPINTISGGIGIVGTWRPYSVEIEAIQRHTPKIDLVANESLHIGTDGSIQDYRYNSKPTKEFRIGILHGDIGLTKLKENVINIRKAGWRCNSTCGIHVHIDAHGLTEEKLNNLHASFINCQESFFALTHPLRRYANGTSKSGHYCKINDNTNYKMEDRYHALNIKESIIRHGTIEYRFFQGTTNWVRVVRIVQLLTNFTELALEKVYTSNNVFDIVTNNEIRAYWKEVNSKQMKKAKELEIKSYIANNSLYKICKKKTITDESLQEESIILA